MITSWCLAMQGADPCLLHSAMSAMHLWELLGRSALSCGWRPANLAITTSMQAFAVSVCALAMRSALLQLGAS